MEAKRREFTMLWPAKFSLSVLKESVCDFFGVGSALSYRQNRASPLLCQAESLNFSKPRRKIWVNLENLHAPRLRCR